MLVINTPAQHEAPEHAALTDISWSWSDGAQYSVSATLLLEETTRVLTWLRHHQNILGISDLAASRVSVTDAISEFDDLLLEWSTFFVGFDREGCERYMGELIRSGTTLTFQEAPGIVRFRGLSSSPIDNR
ncbi:hypothetical protein [Nisaea sediminum]|jgi:hypothetical protein|uniref:hypothetical protein n=1 Tax=Nisaea sediminum TaxID=2775867 RepID=UPI001868A508|nr:hypothetical protein [Nisaea sediminum]